MAPPYLRLPLASRNVIRWPGPLPDHMVGPRPGERKHRTARGWLLPWIGAIRTAVGLWGGGAICKEPASGFVAS